VTATTTSGLHAGPRTDERIVDAALAQFGSRGYEATSLDAIAAVLGVRKQTILYWFPSKEDLLRAVVERAAGALGSAIEAELVTAGPGLARVDAVLRVVFRFGVRQPALLGLLREANRLDPAVTAELGRLLTPLIERAVALLEAEMDAGTIRRADPRALLLLVYATAVGVATEAEAQRIVGLQRGPVGLRRLRRELFAFVRAALGAPAA
jgi:TetR/AcrR family transcriptional regulator